MPPPPKLAVLAQLRLALAACGRPAEDDAPAVIGTGVVSLDRRLPTGGVPRGSLVEWLGERAGSGAETLALVLAREACRDRGVLVVIDPRREFYPPAAVAWGVAAERQVVVHPADDAAALWAADQALRNPAVAAVWLRRDRLRPTDARRLQLAAEASSAVGLLLRPMSARGQPSWADVQLAVEPRPAGHGRRLRVTVTRCRGGPAGGVADVELDDINGNPCEGDNHATHRVPAAE
jgi:hypothetical protein